MNEYFLDDLNDVARSYADLQTEQIKSLYRLQAELKRTVADGHQTLTVLGYVAFSNFMRNNKLTVVEEYNSDGSVVSTSFSGWYYRTITTRVIPISSITTDQLNPIFFHVD